MHIEWGPRENQSYSFVVIMLREFRKKLRMVGNWVGVVSTMEYCCIILIWLKGTIVNICWSSHFTFFLLGIITSDSSPSRLRQTPQLPTHIIERQKICGGFITISSTPYMYSSWQKQSQNQKSLFIVDVFQEKYSKSKKLIIHYNL